MAFKKLGFAIVQIRNRSDSQNRYRPFESRFACVRFPFEDTWPTILELFEIATRLAVAFDTEFVAEDSYRPELCLVQVATEDEIAIIDPYACGDLNPFWQSLIDPGQRTEAVDWKVVDFANPIVFPPCRESCR